jgi:hypothetical protein
MDSTRDTLKAFVERLLETNPGAVRLFVATTEEEFDDGLEDLLERAAAYLEQNANHLCESSEDHITMVLVARLNTEFVRATQEAHSNGHVDITIESVANTPLRRRLGEAKIYRGPAYHVSGLEQLLQRYATGREGAGILVEYVQQAGIKNLVTGIRDHLDERKPCGQDGESAPHRIKWAFTTHHLHSSGERMRVLHLNCNVCRPG